MYLKLSLHKSVKRRVSKGCYSLILITWPVFSEW